MSAEVTIQIGERQVLADLEPNNLQGLRTEFEEICKEDESLSLRRRKYAPIFWIDYNGVRAEVKRKHLFKDKETVYVNWTPSNSEETQVHEEINKPNQSSTSSSRRRRSRSVESECPESYGEVEEYYTTDDWKRMPKYLKEREKNRFELHETQMKRGLVTVPFQPMEVSPDTSPEHLGKKRKVNPTSRKEINEDTSSEKTFSEHTDSSEESDFSEETDSPEPVSHKRRRKGADRKDMDDSRSLVSKSTNGDHQEAGPSNAGDLLTQEGIRKIKPQLPMYDIPKILEKKYNKGNDCLRTAITNLKKNGIATGKERQLLIRVLTRHLYFKIAKNPREATPDMREGLAKSIVFHYTKFQDPYDGKDTYPWKSMFDRQNGRGWIANVSRSIQKKYRTKRSSKSKKKENTMNPTEQALLKATENEKIQALGLLMPGRAEKNKILDGMSDTYENRNEMRTQQMPMTVILKKFPHLANYDGEVLQEEFCRMRPDADDMSLKFTRLQPNILALDSTEIPLPIEDDVIRALVIMSRKLPRDIRTRRDPKKKSNAANLHDILEVVQLGQDIDEFIQDKIQKADGPIQPYLVVVRSPVRNKVAKCFLVLDIKPVQLSSTSLVKCLEILLKAYFIFNVQYPLGWRSTLHCLATCFANIFEDQGPRCRPDSITPSERDFMNSLKT